MYVLASHDGHYSRGAQRRIFAAAENRVDKARHERGVQSYLKSCLNDVRYGIGEEVKKKPGDN